MSEELGPRIWEDLPDDFYLVLGRIAVEFSLLEILVTTWVQDRISPDRAVGVAVTADDQLAKLIALGKKLLPITGPENGRAQAGKALDAAEACRKRRNEILHSLWGPPTSKSKGKILKISRNKAKGIELAYSDEKVETLGKLVDEILAATNMFLTLVGFPGNRFDIRPEHLSNE